MLALKDRGINLLKSEKRTLVSFLLLYSFFSIIILAFIGFIYYDLQKDIMLQKRKSLLQKYSNELIVRLKHLHINFDKYKIYPRDMKFNSAIYDSEEKLIFSTLEKREINLNKNLYKVEDKIHFVRLMESYYLGAMYIVLEINDDERWLDFFKIEIVFAGAALFIVLLFAGYFLLRLLLKPMREAMYLLDGFIRDTTHELNTPVTAILTNIEMIDQSRLDPKLSKKIHRMDIAARTISNIYHDLTYIVLHNKTFSKDENLNLSKLTKERIEFFKVIAEPKKITFITMIDEDVFLYIDRNKISRVIDNIISNAIKYNKKNGTIKITLNENTLVIEDSGIGLEKEKIKLIFERYARFNKSEGGFGLGLSIVSIIAKEYHLDIKIDSELNIGTKVTLKWQKKS